MIADKQQNPLHRANFIDASASTQNQEAISTFIEDGYGYPFRVQYSPTKGLHAVASRDIVAGEVVLRECPIAMSIDDGYSRDYCGMCTAKLSGDEVRQWLSKSSNEKSSVLCDECSANNYVVDVNNFMLRQNIKLVSSSSKSGGGNGGKNDQTSLYSIFFRMFLDYAGARSAALDDNVVTLDVRAACMLCFDDRGTGIDLLTDIVSIADVLAQIIPPGELSSSQIVSLCRTLVCNQHAITTQNNKEIGRAFCPAAAVFNHSCDPNLSWEISPSTRGLIVCTATKDIKCGDDICISYFNPLDIPFKQRRELLMDKMHFLCGCARCRQEQLCCDTGCDNAKTAEGKCLSACSKCKSAWYCSRQCQLKHWPSHKSDCRLMASPKMMIE